MSSLAPNVWNWEIDPGILGLGSGVWGLGVGVALDFECARMLRIISACTYAHLLWTRGAWIADRGLLPPPAPKIPLSYHYHSKSQYSGRHTRYAAGNRWTEQMDAQSPNNTRSFREWRVLMVVYKTEQE